MQTVQLMFYETGVIGVWCSGVVDLPCHIKICSRIIWPYHNRFELFKIGKSQKKHVVQSKTVFSWKKFSKIVTFPGVGASAAILSGRECQKVLETTYT